MAQFSTVQMSKQIVIMLKNKPNTLVKTVRPNSPRSNASCDLNCNVGIECIWFVVYRRCLSIREGCKCTFLLSCLHGEPLEGII